MFASEKTMKSLAVVDVETTGLNPHLHDRVVEVAAVLVAPGQAISAELTTLVNPERDVGPTSIHGITASDIINAPRFAEIAGHLTEFLRGSIALVGHNVRFDVSFLQSEYERMGVKMPRYTMLDTMTLAGGGTLSVCCTEHGIKYDGIAHSALHDARATAFLLQKMFLEIPDLLSQYGSSNPPTWPIFQPPFSRLLPRGSLQGTSTPMPSYVQRLAGRLSVGSADASQPEGERDYRSLLWRALEDGRLEESEGDALVDVATHWGLSFDRVKAIHLDYISQLAEAAWADRSITEAERREIQLAAKLLGFGVLSDEQLHNLLRSRESSVLFNLGAIPTEDWKGQAVCFTGECSCRIRGQVISREMAERIATDKGLRVLPSVTKKLDLLVVSDPNTQSGKAKKAREYGIRIVHEPIFWRSLGVRVD
jgi:DNA polymerase-3 subunit epsilon